MKRIGQHFMEQTRHQHLGPSDQMQGLPQPPLETTIDSVKLPLPDPEPEQIRPLTIGQAIEQRQSIRAYRGAALTQGELSYLLWCTQGVKRVKPGQATFRTVPSAGARHCLETYLLINRIASLDPGLYHFAAGEHALNILNTEPDLADRFTEACLGQSFVQASAVTFIWAASAYRMTWRYGERGYRYMHLDAGHVCQNLYLCAEAIDCGVCAIAAFSDEKMNQLLDLDGEKDFTVYLATVGKKNG